LLLSLTAPLSGASAHSGAINGDDARSGGFNDRDHIGQPEAAVELDWAVVMNHRSVEAFASASDVDPDPIGHE
jgi:hypothetical protein